MHYKQLSLEERERLYALRESGMSFREISTKLNRSHTTLSREYKRNAPYLYGEYIPIKAHNKYFKRGKKQRRKAPLKSPEILLYVREKLREEQWSPETISAKLKSETGLCIHHETIYRYIYHKDNRKYQLWNYLTYKRKRRQKWSGRSSTRENRINNAISIEERPKEIASRIEYGHWETDLMESPRGKQHSLLVNIERKTRYIKIARIPNKKASTNTQNMLRLLKRYKPKTITSDNGLENAKHEQISQELNTKYYFCHPYSSWEKGSVENRIGVIRRYLPKGTDLAQLSLRQIKLLEKKINNRPMKCLNYLTPLQALRKELNML
ncbi:IS30 family transposase [Candidatus Nomurabacteria bacterium]|nr:IS30 family transposase [Candidatus Nomurabacteria bacterium]